MEIKKGDITQENTDAIVISTNKDLNLSGGNYDKRRYVYLQVLWYFLNADTTCLKILSTNLKTTV